MVMMEYYDSNSSVFLANGKLAIGIKYTADSMEIVGNLNSIEYVLFHHRSANGQHLFAVKGVCKVVSTKDIESDRFKNIDTTKMYVIVDIDTSAEIDATGIDPTKKEFTKKTRYDAQFVRMDELRVV